MESFLLQKSSLNCTFCFVPVYRYIERRYTVKIWREGGRIALYESRITRNFFFSNELDREVASFTDPGTLARLEAGWVGFWVQYRHQQGYGGQLSVGLNGAPFSSEFALVRWTDTSTSALSAVRHIGTARLFTISFSSLAIYLFLQDSRRGVDRLSWSSARTACC